MVLNLPKSSTAAASPSLQWSISQQQLLSGRLSPSSSTILFDHDDDNLQPVAPGIPLHIMPIGDSITAGFRSKFGNGYRLPLFNLLRSGRNENDDSKVTFVGTQRNGNMTDDAHEGYGGAKIQQITRAVHDPLRNLRPNVVLVHAGTNDMNILRWGSDSPASAPAQLGELIDDIVLACPDATVLVAKLIQSSIRGTKERVVEFNKEVPSVVEARAEKGSKVLMVDMSSIGEGGKSLADGLHPDDKGYEQMAELWYSGLRTAGMKGWITPPVLSVEEVAAATTSIATSALGMRGGMGWGDRAEWQRGWGDARGRQMRLGNDRGRRGAWGKGEKQS